MSEGLEGGMRVLVVDDASLVRLYYRRALEGARYGVEEAINGIEAMEKILEHDFDLVIVDVNMPKMDGLTFLRALRRREPPVSTVPVLVTSTEAGAHDMAAAREAGANYYLVKPAAEADLLRHVAILAGRPA